MNTSSIYVAAASKELKRALHWMSFLRGEGIEPTYDWTSDVKDSPGDHLLDISTRRQFVQNDLSAIYNSQIVWALIPEEKTHSVGMWVELGWASAKKKTIIVSGRNCFCSIFTELATHKFKEDSDAFEWVKENLVPEAQ